MQNQASGVRNAKPQEFRLSRRVAASFNHFLETNRLPAFALGAGSQFEPVVHARASTFEGGRSGKR